MTYTEALALADALTVGTPSEQTRIAAARAIRILVQHAEVIEKQMQVTSARMEQIKALL